MGLFGSSDKKSEIDKIKKRIEQEKIKIKSCQSNIAECRHRTNSNMKYLIDGHKKRIEELKKNISGMKEEITKIRSKK